jgi:hypothetical protein
MLFFIPHLTYSFHNYQSKGMSGCEFYNIFQFFSFSLIFFFIFFLYSILLFGFSLFYGSFLQLVCVEFCCVDLTKFWENFESYIFESTSLRYILFDSQKLAQKKKKYIFWENNKSKLWVYGAHDFFPFIYEKKRAKMREKYNDFGRTETLQRKLHHIIQLKFKIQSWWK